MQSKIRMIIIDKNKNRIEEILRDLVNEPKIEIIHVCQDCLTGIKIAKSKNVDIILLDTEVEGIKDTSATTLLNINIPNVIVIALSSDNNNIRLKKALISGADEYISQPFTKEELIKTIIHIYEKEHMKNYLYMKHQARVISVFNTKGGVGRSILSANLSIALKQLIKKPVALMDLDFDYGDISLIMNICPHIQPYNIKEKLTNLDDNTIRDFFEEHYSGVDVFAVLNEKRDIITETELKKIIRLAKEEYQYILMDMSPAFSPMNTTVLKESDFIILVTTLELSSIKNTVQALNAFKSLNLDFEHIYIVLNRFERDIGININDIKKLIVKNDILTVPEDKKTVIQSVNSGQPFVLSKKNTPISKSILNIASKIILENKKWGVRDELKESRGRQ